LFWRWSEEKAPPTQQPQLNIDMETSGDGHREDFPGSPRRWPTGRWVLPVMALCLALGVGIGVIWFLLAGDAANNQRQLLQEVYFPAVKVALKLDGSANNRLPVGHGRCNHILMRNCLQVTITREIQKDPAQLQALMDAMLRPCVVLKSENALGVLEEYQVRQLEQRRDKKIRSMTPTELRMAAKQAASKELKTARILVNLADSCGLRTRSRGGPILTFIFEGDEFAISTKMTTVSD